MMNHTQKHTTGKKLLALLLALVMMLSLLPTSVLATGSEPTVVIAGSDFQNKSDDEAGAATVTSILTQIQKDYTSVDGFLFAGDYDQDTHNSNTEVTKGITALMQAVQDKYTNINYDNTILVQGNHDNAHNAIDATGANDADEYGVYVLNEDDYTAYGGSLSNSRTLAAGLTAYFNEKIAAGYNKPVFVVSHVPLHAGPRVAHDGTAKYAEPIFDAINDAAKDLNIIFLFGHNHSKDHDAFLGGSAIYLEKGDTLYVANGSTTTFVEKTLNFTYMNAGYVGYYEDYSDADSALTMTTFEIVGNEVTIRRYDANGSHVLKHAGAHTTYSYSNSDAANFKNIVSANTDTYDSPQTVSMAPAQTFTDDGTGISVTTKTGTGLTVSKLSNTATYPNIEKYELYDISVTGFTAGSKATVSIPVPNGYDAALTRVYYVNNGALVNMSATVSGGMATFVTDHFSQYMLAQADPAALEWVELPAVTEVKEVTALTGGEKIIIRCVRDDTLYVTNQVFTNSDKDTSMLRQVTGQENASVWTVIKNDDGTYYLQDVNGKYMTLGKNTASVSNTATKLNIKWLSEYSKWEISRKPNKTTYYLNHYSQQAQAAGYTSTGSKSEGSRWTFYTRYASDAEWAALDGRNFRFMTSQFSTQAEVEAYIRSQIKVYTASDAQGTGKTETSAYTFSGTLTPTTESNGTLTVYYKGKSLGNISASFIDAQITDISVDKAGNVYVGSNARTETGSTLTVTYDDGTTETVPVNLGMVSGNYDSKKAGTYSGLTITYGNQTITDYTLHVTDVAGDNYPEYPNEGAVRVGKTGEGIDFQSSGIAKVELTATGVPVKKGADVIVMLDTSSSVKDWCICGKKNCGESSATGKYVEGAEHMRRNVILEESLKNLIAQFKTPGDDGQVLDIDVAIADFNRFYTNEGSPYRWDDTDKLTEWGDYTGGNGSNYVYTGTEAIEAGAFVPAKDLAKTYNLNYQSGTNYDYAFDVIYQLGHAAQVRNAQAGEERDLYVVFLSDGAPYQYNYFKSNDQYQWNNWLQGTITDDMYAPDANKNYYNEVNGIHKHRMAEAIKGSPDEKYTIIRKNLTGFETVDTTQTTYDSNMYTVPGLGATMFSIAFCPADDGKTSRESMLKVIQSIASEQTGTTPYYYEVDSANELRSAFTAIGNEIAYAATNARFVDTMGADYDLQMKSSTYTLSDGTTKPITPEITVRAYDIYKTSDVDTYVGGKLVTADMVGKRTGSSTTLEMVSFNAAGTQAYSDKKSGNILVDGVICANTFWYNTTGSAVSIDTDGDGKKDYNLAPETFYWKMGTINQTELALSYYVYLTGSMDGKREEGSYPTNESATLYYTNWLGNEAKKDTVSPVLAWKSANVSYAFYLVNENGEIIVNKTTGQTGSFANKVAVTNPVVYREVLLNSAAELSANILASDVLPEGYALYDTSAAYNVRINSNSTGGWTITKGTDPATTYVTEYGGDPTTQLNATENSYDYTHTVVWFAVKYTVKAIPDAVVVDYGLPVDIHVLTNDMFYDKGVLMYVGAETDGAVTGDANAAFTTTEFKGKYGTATVMANASVPEDIVVRYTPANMQMNSVDKFSYAVHYTGTENSGYYYGTVTVIPAANIYYEDSFVTTKDSSAEDGTYGVWTTDGTTDSKTQAEDRPGTASVLADANNLYGYDAAYANFKKFSLGSAKKVTVNAATGTPNTAPTASFTFTGTGFDIISLTDNRSGTIVVTVKNTKTNETKNYSVNNYFGYTYSGGTWTPTNSADPNALYQVPVIKVEDLTYDTYDVTIKVAYLKSLDQRDTGECSFWLDAVRIYDPAKNDETANNAYSADKESSPDYAEVRNLLIDGNKFAVDGASVTGAVFIDGIASDATIQQFTEFGPNNEAYLAANQAIAFQLVANSVPESVQLGAKLAVGNSATLYFNGKEFKTLSTATDMYYALSGLNWTKNETNDIYTSDVVVLQHKGGDGIISLTNIKITGGAAFIETSADPLNEVKLAKEPVVMALASPQMASRALKMVAVYEEPAPEILSVVADSAEVMVGDTVKLTVTTNADTDYILVNAAAVETYTEDEAGNRVWTYEAKAEEAGEVSFTVTAMSADGHESEESTCTVDVQQPAKPANDIAAMVKKAMNAFHKIFDAIFGWRR